MQHIIKSYLKFLWKSTNAHGVHSPFVFDLVRKCFYDKTNYPEYKVLDDYRNSLLQNKNTIEVTDFGAGSRVFKSNVRAINKVAENAGISPKDAQLLFRVVHYFQPEKILEIGTSLGLATSALAQNNVAEITTLEGCPNTMAIAKNQLQLQFPTFENKINFVVTEFESHLQTYPEVSGLKPQTLNLIYLDGNHSKEATLNYFELLLPTISNETVWIFDDIHWSKGMEEAWEIIKKHPKVTVTIDTFQWGFVFFRKEQVKEDFIIRTSKSFFLDQILGIKNLWGLLH
ncbi:class I SAM-dependent methyltransferase [Flavobacterium sp. NST-5]|uniref:Class I SAM-dependent methyltransferase n=1 Tax=Flavobacterium ichthyis TaxID=2698827 RepID=A0ABW9ZAG2_9FLAO|nr:class I SAM-dependent methyltransferase [Flavobacterium ichthyis]NBL65875.1 class I SAM-dependent methyltransferase [Flavobacterium ichthyis]